MAAHDDEQRREAETSDNGLDGAPGLHPREDQVSPQGIVMFRGQTASVRRSCFIDLMEDVTSSQGGDRQHRSCRGRSGGGGGV